MKQFFIQVFASLFGIILGLILFVFIGSLIIGGLVASASKEKTIEIKNNSVLKIRFEGQIKERSDKLPPWLQFGSGIGAVDNSIGLDEIIQTLRSAKEDPKIKGIYLETHIFNSAMASLTTIRKELMAFKKSGKFIYAYTEMASEKGYYLASAADSIFIYPTGMLEWNGLNSNPMFLKGFFEKWGLDPLLFRVGKFKSAGETFTEKQMSEMNRLQTKTLLDDFWTHILTTVSEARKISIQDLDSIASGLKITDAKLAVKYKLVDAVMYPDQVEELLKKRCKTEAKDKLNEISFHKYAKNLKANDTNNSLTNKIAVIYAVGEIRSGKGDEDKIGSETLCEQIKKAREDETVKAIVLRVSSPGGSALASDVIGREVLLAKKVKPVIASFGDVAASGGYYISAGCDKILAEPTTITGSIGVFGLLFNTQKFFNNELGISFDRVHSSNNQYADLGDPNRSMSEFEKQIIQNGVNKVYSEFIEVVRLGRRYADSVAVDSIAQGRVWAGKRALDLKLVDQIGGLDDAIAVAAQKVGLSKGNYSIINYPEKKNFIERLAEDMNTKMEYNTLIKYIPKEYIQAIKSLESFNDPKRIYLRDPNSYSFE